MGDERSYSTREVEEITGVARGSLRYYEQVGALEPQRSASSHFRAYTDRDLARIMTCTMLKNCDIPLTDASVDMTDDDGPEAILRRCAQNNERRQRWDEAVGDGIARLRGLYVDRAPLTPFLVAPDPWAFLPNQEHVGAPIVRSEAHKAMFQGVPFCVTAALFELSPLRDVPMRGRWGHAVRTRHLAALPQPTAEAADAWPVDGQPATFQGGWLRFGESPCACVTLRLSPDEIDPLDKRGIIRDVMYGFLDDQGLRPQGVSLLTYDLPLGDRVYVTLATPVEAIGGAGRRALRRLAHA